MELRREEDKLVLCVPSNASIFNVEEDFLKVCDELVINHLKRIEVDISQVEEIDTAYLQLILSIINTVKDNFEVSLGGDNRVFTEVLELYGIDSGVVNNGKVYFNS